MSKQTWGGVAFLVAASGCGDLAAQGFESQTPGVGSPSAFDSVRGTIVAFGGDVNLPASDRTWEFDGRGWLVMHPVARPTARIGGCMTFDALRNRAVLFGGDASVNGPSLNDTWTYDGVTWTQVVTPVAPTSRSGRLMTFDPVRGRVVMVGQDVWEFDGIAWTQAPSCPAYRLTAPAFDAARSLVVAFEPAQIGPGGGAAVWEFNGAQWTHNPNGFPGDSIVSACSRTNGAGVAVVDGSWLGNFLYEFDGTTWSAPVQIAGATLHLDAANSRLLVTDGPVQEVNAVGPTFLTPPHRVNSALAFDKSRGCAVLHGGFSGPFLPALDDTWELRGHTWTEVVTAHTPAVRWDATMTFDSRRARSVLHGVAANLQPQTWAFDGNDWSLISVGGPAGSWGEMAYDPLRDRVFWFGLGVSQGTVQGWEFDGSVWSQQSMPASATSWPFRMTFDSRRGVMVLLDGANVLSENSGSGWVLVTTPTVPGQIDGGIGFDPVRGHVIAQGVSGLWEYDGFDWTQAGPLGLNSAMPLVYDTAAKRLIGVWAGGNIVRYVLPPVASCVRHGTGCAGSAGVPTLDGTNLPSLGSTFTLQLGALPAFGTIAYLAFGFDFTTWNGMPLPAELGMFGMPGCHLWMEPATGALLSSNQGTATLSLPIPALSALSGLVLGAQAFTFDAQAPSQVGAVSNGLLCRLH